MTKDAMIYLVYGSNGQQGGAVVRALVSQGKRVRLLLRNPERSQFRADERVELCRGDLNDIASLRAASRGVAGVSLTLPLSFDFERTWQWGQNAIDAAADADVPTLVWNTSGLGVNEPVGVPLLDTKHLVSRYLQQARVPSVTLNATLYSGNLGAPWSAPLIVEQGMLVYPLPAEQRVSWLSWEEAASYVALALARPDLAARKLVLQMGGAQALSGHELAAAVSAAVQRSVTYVQAPMDRFAAGIDAQFGAPAGTELRRYYEWLGRRDTPSRLAVDLVPLRKELDVPQTSFDAWAREFPWALLAGGAK